MEEEDSKIAQIVRREVEKDIVAKVGDRVNVVMWFEALGLDRELTMREIKEKGIISYDNVHLANEWRAIFCSELCYRLEEDGELEERRSGSSMSLGASASGARSSNGGRRWQEETRGGDGGGRDWRMGATDWRLLPSTPNRGRGSDWRPLIPQFGRGSAGGGGTRGPVSRAGTSGGGGGRGMLERRGPTPSFGRGWGSGSGGSGWRGGGGGNG